MSHHDHHLEVLKLAVIELDSVLAEIANRSENLRILEQVVSGRF